MDFTGTYRRRDFVCFLIPLIAAELFQQIYGLINTAVVSRALDYSALAVVGSCSGLLEVRGNILTGMFYGFGIYLGTAVGSGDPRRLSAAFSACLRYTFLLSALGAAAAFGIHPLMDLGRIPLELRGDAGLYLIISFAGSGAAAVRLLLLVLLQAVGDTAFFSLLASLGAVTNTVLVVTLIGVLKGSVACSSLASVLTDLLLALFLFWYIRRKKPELFRTIPWRNIPKNIRHQLLENGFAKTAYFFLGALGAVILQRGINTLPSRLIAGQALALPLQGILLAPLGELGTASGVMTGQNVGAGKYGNVLTCHRRLTRIFLVLGFAETILAWLAGRSLLAYTAGSSADFLVIESAFSWLRITALFLPVSLGILYRNTLQAMGRYPFVIVLGVTEFLICMLTARFLIPSLGLAGGALGVGLSWGIQAILGTVLFSVSLKGGCKDGH